MGDYRENVKFVEELRRSNMEIREQLVKRFGLMEAEEILQTPVSRQCKVCGGKKIVDRSGRAYHCPTCNGTGEETKTLEQIYNNWKEGKSWRKKMCRSRA